MAVITTAALISAAPKVDAPLASFCGSADEDLMHPGSPGSSSSQAFLNKINPDEPPRVFGD